MKPVRDALRSWAVGAHDDLTNQISDMLDAAAGADERGDGAARDELLGEAVRAARARRAVRELER
jgi:hypothetical protein